MGIFENKEMESIFVLSIQIPLLAKYKIIQYRVLSVRNKTQIGFSFFISFPFSAVAYLFFFFYSASTKSDIGDQNSSHTEIIWSRESRPTRPAGRKILIGR